MKIHLLTFLCMISGNIVTAQDKSEAVLRWDLASILPPDSSNCLSPGIAGPVAGIHEGMLFVGGGANFPEAMPWMGGLKKYHRTLYAFQQQSNGKLVTAGKYELPENIAYVACASTPAGIVYVGGENERGFSKKAYLIKWDKKNKDLIFHPLPDLPMAVSNGSIVAEREYIFFAGGETQKGTTDIFLLLNLKEPGKGWQALPSLPKPVSHAVFRSLSIQEKSKLFLIGGRKKNLNGISDLFSSVYSFDIAANKWQQEKDLPYPLSAGTGITTEQNSILLFGGDKGETFSRTEKLIAAINREKDPQAKEKLNQEKIRLQSAHPGFNNTILEFKPERGTWEQKGMIPFEVPVTTTAIRLENHVWLPSGEIRAGVRTPGILVGYLPDANEK